MTAEWRGSVYVRGRKLWLRLKLDGEWTDRPTPFYVGEEAKARALLGKIRDKVAAGEALGDADLGPLTVRRYSERWLEHRKRLVPDWPSDDSHLRVHILPAIGDVRLEDVRPRHLAALVERLRLDGAASRTVRNVYSTCRSMFRDAAIADLIPSSPCILTKHHIGKIRDRDPEWRQCAVYTRDEVEALISDERVRNDCRVLYAILCLTGMRYGEGAGLRWRHLDLDAKPLGRIAVATSYNTGRTKTGVERRAPVHPTLAAILAEWRLSGWAEMFGRQPEPDDLVIPRRLDGLMHSKSSIGHRLALDLRNLGLRHRRGHDLRSTFVSLAREDGAAPDVLRLVTHAPSRDILDLYTRVPWERLCTEVAKIRVERRKPAKLLPLHFESCCSGLLQSEETARQITALVSGGAGNRIPTGDPDAT